MPFRFLLFIIHFKSIKSGYDMLLDVVMNGTLIDSVRACRIVRWVMPLAAEAKSQGKRGFSIIGKVYGCQLKEGFCLCRTPSLPALDVG